MVAFERAKKREKWGAKKVKNGRDAPASSGKEACPDTEVVKKGKENTCTKKIQKKRGKGQKGGARVSHLST